MMFKKSLLHHERYLQYPRVTSLIMQTAAQILEEKHYFQMIQSRYYLLELQVVEILPDGQYPDISILITVVKLVTEYLESACFKSR